MSDHTNRRETQSPLHAAAVGSVTSEGSIVVRRATAADRTPLVRLAELDSATPLCGDILLAEVAGELCAARSLADGRAIGDPFRPTAMLLGLLEFHARQLSDRGLAAGRAPRWRRHSPGVAALAHRRVRGAQ